MSGPVEIAVRGQLEAGRSVTLAAIGGEQAALAEADQLAVSPFFPEVVAAFLADWNRLVNPDQAAELLVDGCRRNTYPVALNEALSAVCASEHLLRPLAQRLAHALLERVEQRFEERDALNAAECLRGAARFALQGRMPRFALLTTIAGLAEPPERELDLFARPAARVVGTCFEVWRESELLEVLERLLSVTDVQADAAVELGRAEFSLALAGTSRQDVSEHLGRAREMFADAEALEADRTDAVTYRAVIDVLRGFVSDDAAALEESLTVLERAVTERQLDLRGMRDSSWLAGRLQAETHWWQVAKLLEQTAQHLPRPSWLQATKVLPVVLEAYSIDRGWTTVEGIGAHDAPGLAALVHTRIETDFLEREGLRGHLDDWLEHASEDDPHYTTAVDLQARVRRRSGEREAASNPPLCAPGLADQAGIWFLTL